MLLSHAPALDRCPFFHHWLLALGLDPKAARQLWQGMSRCSHPKVRALAYLFQSLDVRDFWGSLERLTGSYSPVQLATVVEEVAHEGLAPRAVVNAFQEEMIRECTRDGTWRLTSMR